MTVVRHRRWPEILIYSPVLLCMLVMLPRLASPQFGLLDDGWNLGIARQIAAGDWQAAFTAQAVRFRPLYWLLPGLIYRLAGPEPLAFFASGLLHYSAATAFLIGWVRKEGGTRVQALLTGTLFAASGPAIEAYYTLAKSESLQVTWLMASMLVLASVRKGERRMARATKIVVGTGLLLLAYGSKETAMVMLPIVVAWSALAGRLQGPLSGSDQPDRRAAYLAANLACLPVIGFLLYRFYLLPAEPGLYVHGYGSTSVDLVASVIRWAGWLLRDFPYLVPLLIYLAWQALFRRRASAPPLVWESMIWILGWVIVYLPWGFTAEYYLLPAALGAAVLSGALGSALIRPPVSEPWGPRWLRKGAAALSVLGLAITLPNNLTAARIQMTVDQLNARLLVGIADALPQDSMLLVALPETSEYLREIRIQLSDLYRRPDLVARTYTDPDGDLPADRSGGYLLTPSIAGRPYFGVRVGIGEEDASRGEALIAELGDSAVLQFELERSFTRTNVSLPALICPLIGRSAYCTQARPFIDLGTFSYGWRLYALHGQLPNPAVPPA